MWRVSVSLPHMQPTAGDCLCQMCSQLLEIFCVVSGQMSTYVEHAGGPDKLIWIFAFTPNAPPFNVQKISG